jgi:transposase InsO family protein
MAHANAPLSELGRLRLAMAHLESGAAIRQSAERFQVSTTTVIRWRDRYLAVLAEGRTPTVADMGDRSSRPHRSPARTRAGLERRVVHLRRTRRLGPVQIAGRVGLAASTVHAILTREGLNRLASMDRVTGQVIRRYERDRPGDLVHVDVKKFGNVPPGGGWKVHGRAATEAGHSALERANRAARDARGTGRAGYGYLHAAVDDHSRLAYAEIHDDETGATAVAFWHRAVDFFASHGITISEVLTDNGAAYRSLAWADALADHGQRHRRTRPYRPQTNGKVERFNRTIRDEWAYAKPYRSEAARRATLEGWLHIYNQHRPHTALGGQPPITRATNVPGQNI